MSTATLPKPQQRGGAGRLVEMSWDPITRIVGSLGIYTKIDFDSKKVIECYSTSSIFRGYSIFMMLITAAIAVPVSYSTRFQFLHWHLGTAAGVLSLGFGLFLVYQIGYVDGLFVR